MPILAVDSRCNDVALRSLLISAKLCCEEREWNCMLSRRRRDPVALRDGRATRPDDCAFHHDRRVTTSFRAAQAPISFFWIAVAIRSGNRSGVHAKLGAPRAVIFAASC